MTDRRILVLRTALLWILLELVAAAQVHSPAGDLVLWVWARTAISPVAWAGRTVVSTLSGVATAISSSRELVVENRRLAIELEAARAFRLIMDEDMAAQRELEPLVAMVPKQASSAVPARISYRDLVRGRMIGAHDLWLAAAAYCEPLPSVVWL